MEYTIESQLDLARELVRNTDKTIFLTGKAGTGKTTFLRNLPTITSKKMAVVAPTGVAAINARGVTIHSFFQLPFTPYIPESPIENSKHRLRADKIKILRNLDLLVIDEISMVRADLLDAIDTVLQTYRHNKRPFGGVQLLMIGDLYQLAPVIRDYEWDLIKEYYQSPFFFHSNALQNTDYVVVELTKIFRQSDQSFISILNEIRDNRLSDISIERLNERVDPDCECGNGYIYLTTHNKIASEINNEKLDKLDTKARKYKAYINDVFPESLFPTEEYLELKEGAQVMFIKNDTTLNRAYYNGKIGRVVELSNKSIKVESLEDGHIIDVSPVVWENCEYELNAQTGDIDQNILGTFTQYPLKLAWAITIHKSQGLTFDKAIVDVNSAFAFGQVYVALSRCKSLEGLVLKNSIAQNQIMCSNEVMAFCKDTENHKINSDNLLNFKIEYQKKLIFRIFDFSLLYRLLNKIIRIYSQHPSKFNSGYEEILLTIRNSFQTDIIDVNEKFKVQLQSILSDISDSLPQDCDFLQERIKKASYYYFCKLCEEIKQPFKKMIFISDNAEIENEMDTAIEDFDMQYQLQDCGFQLLLNGFTPEGYFKAISVIESHYTRIFNIRRNYEFESLPTLSKKLLSKLYSWREDKAIEIGQPKSIIVAQRSLQEIADKMPHDEKSLLKIKGIGKYKCKMYGPDIIAIVKNFCMEYCPEVLEGNELDFDPKKCKIKKQSTYEITFEMFKEGCTVPDIAFRRGLSRSTIVSHLTKYVANGTLSADRLISNDRYYAVMDFLEENIDKASSIKQLSELCGHKFADEELRIGIASINSKA